MAIKNLQRDIYESYSAGFSARLYQTQEPTHIVSAAHAAAKQLNQEFGIAVKVVCWSRFGFYVDAPLTAPQPDRTGKPMVGINCMMRSVQEMSRMLPNEVANNLKLPFDPKEDIIFVCHDWDGVMAEANGGNSELTTALRAYIQGQLSTPQRDVAGDTVKGKRLILFAAVQGNVSQYLPELTANHVALPGDEASEAAIDNVWAYPMESNIVDPLPDKVREMIVASLKGMTMQDREDALSRAYQSQKGEIRKHRTITDLPAFLQVIEGERARLISSMKGVRYIDKSQLQTVPRLPGFELVDQFMDSVLNVPQEAMRKHNLPGARGIFMVGIPGTGKSQFAAQLAVKANRPLVLLNLGELQGSLVGQSEAQARAFVDMSYEIPMVVVLDELDKMGMGGGGHGGDGGTWDRVQAIFLEAMADTRSLALWVAAANAVKSSDGRMLVKPELMRRGRFDEQYFVEVPDMPVREAILRVHAEFRNIVWTKPDDVTKIASVTEDWVGAELADLIIRGTRQAVTRGMEELPADWMIKYATTVTPLSRQSAFKAVLDATRQECSQFTTIGVSLQKPETQNTPNITLGGRGRRSMTTS
jgi:SpoVK/Ycf46/Vps4 family AAA+-type ATPase